MMAALRLISTKEIDRIRDAQPNNAYAIISLLRYLDLAENIPFLLVFLGSMNA